MKILRLAKMWIGYVRKQVELKYYPFKLWVEPTSACNLRCIMCPQSMERPKKHGYMEMELFKKIIDEAKEFVHDINVHHTGESLLHPKLMEMIKYSESNGIVTKLHTNATLLDKTLANKIFESGLSLLSFSFDGFDAKTYESIRRGAQFENTLSNILNFLRMKKERNSRKPYTIFEVIHLGNKLEKKSDNYNKFIAQFNGLPIEEIRVKEPHNWAGKYQLNVKKDRYAECTFPYYALVVNWNGLVTPCPQDYFCDIELGDMKIQSLKEIWNGSALKELRRRMINKDIEQLVPCNTCDMIRRKKVLGIPSGHVADFVKESVSE